MFFLSLSSHSLDDERGNAAAKFCHQTFRRQYEPEGWLEWTHSSLFCLLLLLALLFVQHQNSFFHSHLHKVDWRKRKVAHKSCAFTAFTFVNRTGNRRQGRRRRREEEGQETELDFLVLNAYRIIFPPFLPGFLQSVANFLTLCSALRSLRQSFFIIDNDTSYADHFCLVYKRQGGCGINVSILQPVLLVVSR